MAFDFDADDVFEIAEQIERNGASFYLKASEKISDGRLKKLLADLSSMETDHLKTFSSMRKSFSQKEKHATAFDPTNESARYLKALADLRVFYEKQVEPFSIESILLNAIIAEKDSIVFYVGMKDIVPQSLGRDKIDKIINEEKKHLHLLARELGDLNTR
jgi:rubrerythrin